MKRLGKKNGFWGKNIFFSEKKLWQKKNWLFWLYVKVQWASSNGELTIADVIEPYFSTKLRFSVSILRVILNFLKIAYDK